MPTFHPVLGHLIALKESISALPRNITMHVVVRRMASQFPNGVFYLNLWPFSDTIMVVGDPYVASQVEAASLDKPRWMCSTLEVINGGQSIQSMHGPTWKKWRGLFNSGFAGGYIIGLAPAIADEVAVFCELLKGLAERGDLFQLEEYTLRLTFDVIARVTLDARLHYQTQGSALADCLRRQILWTPFGTTFNPVRRYLSPRPLVQKYNSHRMDTYLDSQIDQRFDEAYASPDTSSHQLRKPSRSIISLAMSDYMGDVKEADLSSRNTFKALVKPHLRMFLYAGHDTTSSTLLYCYLLLSQHPEAMARLRSEHDHVFGSNATTAYCSDTIAKDPTLLNHIPYTAAVIKEVLRLFPPAGSLRAGRSGLVLVDEEGRQYPTENCNIWTLTLLMHRHPNAFVKPEEFIPDRWLAGPQDPLYPKKGAWRPFEWGARDCIGQTLAQLELKIALVMTARAFDISPAYEEFDRLHPSKGIKTVDGDRAYQAELGGGGAHPADAFPVRVALREQAVGST
ncbi:cytochrome P450 [Xylariomycetidae sp. FL0641]|nr:cytochrome P450 [Xylariomycetidae sp. FL0641]